MRRLSRLRYRSSGSALAAPDQVTGLTLGAFGATTQTLSWSAPSGGGAPADYEVQYAPAGSGSWATFADGTSTGTSATVTGLTADTNYDYRVRATNGAGAGPYSATVTGYTLRVPGQVTGLTLGTATSSTQPLSWSAPAGGGAVADYEVQYAPAGSGSWVTYADSVSAVASVTVTGLSASTSYDYHVRATNAAGSGSYSATATGSTASSSGTGQATISWEAPIEGPAITAWKVVWGQTTRTYTADSGDLTSPSSSTVNGVTAYSYTTPANLASGTWYFAVIAKDAAGNELSVSYEQTKVIP